MQESTKKLLSLNEKEREDLIKKSFEEAGVEISEVRDSEIANSRSKLKVGEFLTIEKTKNWVEIKYGIKDDDYIYHVFLKRPIPGIPDEVIYYIFEKTVLPLIPDTVEVILSPPKEVFMGKELYKIGCYTLIIKSIANRPGSKQRMEDRLVGLLLDNIDKLYKFSVKEKEDIISEVRNIIHERRPK